MGSGCHRSLALVPAVPLKGRSPAPSCARQEAGLLPGRRMIAPAPVVDGPGWLTLRRKAGYWRACDREVSVPRAPAPPVGAWPAARGSDTERKGDVGAGDPVRGAGNGVSD